MCLLGGSATFTGCTIENNTAGQGGGVAIMDKSAVTLDDCVVTGNRATLDGAGIYMVGWCSLTL